MKLHVILIKERNLLEDTTHRLEYFVDDATETKAEKHNEGNGIIYAPEQHMSVGTGFSLHSAGKLIQKSVSIHEKE